MKILTSVLTSLDRVWPDSAPQSTLQKITALKNETYSFQIAYRGDNFPNAYAEKPDNAADCTVSVSSPLADCITLRRAVYVSVLRPVYAHSDNMHDRGTPGLYADPLMPVYGGRLRLLADSWQALWITVNPNGKTLEAGTYPITITLKAQDCTENIHVDYTVLNAELEEQDFLCTNWLHCDCIADRYGCEVFSERFWTLLGKYMKCAAQNGQNMVLTPCFTPPLDTPVGGERRTVQLVDVVRTGNAYQFNFSKLERFTKLAEKNGIHYFEHSHLFTQWGAEHAPKIMGTENSEYTRLFGWETDANSDEYRDFLTAYLTALKGFLDASGIGKRMYFHISDEPGLNQLESYGKARKLLGDILSGYTIFDALSHKEFWDHQLLDAPVVATSHIESFLDGQCDNLWAYYTGGQCYDGLSNRLIATPPPRNRIIGFQMYRHHIKGFLHWGYNFWYTTLSRDPYDPLLSPDASGHFVGGTSYLVYPGTDGPIASMRQEVFRDALQDIRLCQLAEQKAGREAVDAVLERHFPELDFHTCPVTPEPLWACRAELLELIG